MTVEQILSYCKIMLQEGWGYILGAAGVMWTAEKQAKTTDSMARKYGAEWIGKMVVDCSGVMVYIWKKFGKSIYHGSNSIARYSVGKFTSIPKPGYAAFKWREKDTSKFQDGKGDFYHIGIVDENAAYVYESRGTKEGFCHNSPVSKWSYFAPFKDVDYSASGEAKEGEKGMNVSYQARIVTKNGGKVNLRSGAGIDNPIIKAYKTGTVVDVKIEYDNSWDFVSVEGQQGYMCADYLEKIEDLPAEEPTDKGCEDLEDYQPTEDEIEWHILLSKAKKYREVLEDMLEAIGKGVDSFNEGSD